MWLRIALLLFATLSLAESKASGAKSKSCSNLNPPSGHGSLRSGNGGYSLTFLPSVTTTYTPGQTYYVTLTGSTSFEGFLLKVSSGSLQAISTTIHKGPCSQPSLTQRSDQPKNSIQFKWVAPSSGSISFDMVVLANYHGSYYKISKPLSSDGASSTIFITTTTTRSTTVTTVTQNRPDISFDAGGSLALPSGCDATTSNTPCDFEANWVPQDGKMYYRLKAKSADWAAIGYSDSPSMRQTDVLMAKIEVTGEPFISNRYSSSYSTPAIDSDQSGVEALFAQKTSTHVELIFSRLLQPINTNDVDLSSTAPKKYLILAAGNGNFQSHTSGGMAITSTIAIQPQASGSVAATASPQGNAYSITHGVLMIWAWTVLCPVAILFPSFMKHIGPLWFSIHKNLQIGVLLLTVVGMIVIIISGVKFKPELHQFLGILVMILVVVQVILAFFRNKISGYKPAVHTAPHDHGPRRHVFNAIHHLTAFILVIAAQVATWQGLVKIGANTMAIWVFAIWAIGSTLIQLLAIITAHSFHDKAVDSKMKSYLAAFLFAFSFACGITLSVLVTYPLEQDSD